MKVALLSLWIILVVIGIAQSDRPEVQLEATPKQEMIDLSHLDLTPNEPEISLEVNF